MHKGNHIKGNQWGKIILYLGPGICFPIVWGGAEILQSTLNKKQKKAFEPNQFKDGLSLGGVRFLFVLNCGSVFFYYGGENGGNGQILTEPSVQVRPFRFFPSP